jgi:hypothetical protein
MKRYAIIAALIITAFGSGTNAEAFVTFDPATGMGSVDIGIIGASFGLAPDQLEKEAQAVGFVLAKEQKFTASCDMVPTVNGVDRTDYILDVSEQRDVDGTLLGFSLDGRGRAIGSSSVPTVGGKCVGDPSSPSARLWTSVDEATPRYRLYVAYGGLQVRVWPGSNSGILRQPVDEWEEIRVSPN